MTKLQELLEATQQNPAHEVMWMFDSTAGNPDYAYTAGRIVKVEVTERIDYGEDIWTAGDEESLLDKITAEVFRDISKTAVSGHHIDVESRKDDLYTIASLIADGELVKCKRTPVIMVYVGD